MKARIIFHGLTKLVLRFDKEKLEKLRFQLLIPESFHKSFQDLFLGCDGNNRAIENAKDDVKFRQDVG